jgi:hypothetical protein
LTARPRGGEAGPTSLRVRRHPIDRQRPSFGWSPHPLARRPRRSDVPWKLFKDGRQWRIGTAADVAWIANATVVGKTITAAIPLVFDAYATFYAFDDPAHADSVGMGEAPLIADLERAVVGHLVDFSGDQPWWLGYLDTGATEVVFPYAPMVSLYSHADYVLVEAGAEQALTWRVGHMRSPKYGVLPDLFFPADRAWLVSALWDDTWTCVGGPTELIDRLRLDPRIQARPVRLGEDATPPGHESL